MAGTGFHPEGHDFAPYTGTLPGYGWICRNCAQLAEDPAVDNGECIDDC